MRHPHRLPTLRHDREVRTEAIPRELLELVKRQADDIERLKKEVISVQSTLERLRSVVS